MNPYLQAQIVNLQSMANNCKETCQWAAKQDDGVISRQEAKTLKAIERAIDKFVRDLKRIK